MCGASDASPLPGITPRPSTTRYLTFYGFDKREYPGFNEDKCLRHFEGKTMKAVRPGPCVTWTPERRALTDTFRESCQQKFGEIGSLWFEYDGKPWLRASVRGPNQALDAPCSYAWSSPHHWGLGHSETHPWFAHREIDITYIEYLAGIYDYDHESDELVHIVCPLGMFESLYIDADCAETFIDMYYDNALLDLSTVVLDFWSDVYHRVHVFIERNTAFADKAKRVFHDLKVWLKHYYFYIEHVVSNALSVRYTQAYWAFVLFYVAIVGATMTIYWSNWIVWSLCMAVVISFERYYSWWSPALFLLLSRAPLSTFVGTSTQYCLDYVLCLFLYIAFFGGYALWLFWPMFFTVWECVVLLGWGQRREGAFTRNSYVVFIVAFVFAFCADSLLYWAMLVLGVLGVKLVFVRLKGPTVRSISRAVRSDGTLDWNETVNLTYDPVGPRWFDKLIGHNSRAKKEEPGSVEKVRRLPFVPQTMGKAVALPVMGEFKSVPTSEYVMRDSEPVDGLGADLLAKGAGGNSKLFPSSSSGSEESRIAVGYVPSRVPRSNYGPPKSYGTDEQSSSGSDGADTESRVFRYTKKPFGRRPTDPYVAKLKSRGLYLPAGESGNSNVFPLALEGMPSRFLPETVQWQHEVDEHRKQLEDEARFNKEYDEIERLTRMFKNYISGEHDDFVADIPSHDKQMFLKAYRADVKGSRDAIISEMIARDEITADMIRYGPVADALINMTDEEYEEFAYQKSEAWKYEDEQVGSEYVPPHRRPIGGRPLGPVQIETSKGVHLEVGAHCDCGISESPITGVPFFKAREDAVIRLFEKGMGDYVFAGTGWVAAGKLFSVGHNFAPNVASVFAKVNGQFLPLTFSERREASENSHLAGWNSCLQGEALVKFVLPQAMASVKSFSVQPFGDKNHKVICLGYHRYEDCLPIDAETLWGSVETCLPDGRARYSSRPGDSGGPVVLSAQGVQTRYVVAVHCQGGVSGNGMNVCWPFTIADCAFINASPINA